MPNLIVHTHLNSPNATAIWNGQEYPALIGKNGATPNKKEGDGCTPLGCYPLELAFYRADRRAKPSTPFAWHALQPGDCWCDEIGHALYNQFIPGTHPLAARFGASGTMLKTGPEYDVLYSLGYNTNPVVQGAGSAILLHGWREGATHSGGCVVLPNDVLAKLADEFQPGDAVDIRLG
jgi:L,D-peptidoglycan transpeptidase YkuD (ErfK/YbiS/YcfS/YnhG family)